MNIRNYFSDSDDSSKLLINFCPPNNATAVQAIQAFENFVGTVKFEYDRDGAQPFCLKISEVHDQIIERPLETAENLSRFQQKYGFQFPSVFVDFILKHGLITIWPAKQISDEGDVAAHRRIPLFAFYNHGDMADLIPNVLDLPMAIANNFTPDFMNSTYSADKIEFLKNHYFVFGHYNYNDQAYDYWFFTKDGQFGSFYFQDENYPKNKEALDTLIDGSIKYETFDHLVSRFISKTIFDFSAVLADY